MLLLLAISFILFEAVSEGLLKRFSLADFIFNNFLQWLIAIFLFALWFVIVYNIDGYYVPVWKLIFGMIAVRFALFDVIWNITRGVKWNFYGTTKLYDRIMERTGSWGCFMKFVLGIVGVCFLMGWE